MEILDVLEAAECSANLAGEIANKISKSMSCCTSSLICGKSIGLIFDIIFVFVFWINGYSNDCDYDVCGPLYDACDALCGDDTYDTNTDYNDYDYDYYWDTECFGPCYEQCSDCEYYQMMAILFLTIVCAERVPMLIVLPIMYCSCEDCLEDITKGDEVKNMCIKVSSFNLTEFLVKINQYRRQQREVDYCDVTQFVLSFILFGVAGFELFVCIYAFVQVWFSMTSNAIADALAVISFSLTLAGIVQEMIIMGRWMHWVCFYVCCFICAIGTISILLPGIILLSE
eukprot:556053_1